MTNAHNIHSRTRGVPSRPGWRHRVAAAAVIIVGLIVAAVVGGWFRTGASESAGPAVYSKSIEQLVAELETSARNNPGNPSAWQRLTEAHIQRAIQTYDPAFYTLATTTLANATRLAPDDPATWRAAASLAVSLHRFDDAASFASRALTADPYDTQSSAVLVDAYTELGRYNDAAQQLQILADQKPGSATLTRISYQRELRGDYDAALVAMDQAATAAVGAPAFDQAAIATYRGDLLWNAGYIEDARGSYQQALDLSSGHATAVLGMARVEAAQGRSEDAIVRLEKLLNRVPLPAAAVLLGELQVATGKTADALRAFKLVDVLATLQATNGVDVDLEITLFRADHTTVTADTITRARRAYINRPNIFSADALAWTLHRAGNNIDARPYMDEALSLGTTDALLHYHAAAIFDALGDQASATTEMTKAAAANQWFSITLRTDALALATKLKVDWDP